ncbi:hypothetical protein F4860DRAFT_242326 [Xylaria cubensis]|nr:hypothetical protein F4860DRAFT_242326 [Xylaria cubensis]
MEFLPLPHAPIHPISEIRLYSCHGYDRGEFATFPERQGWPRTTIANWVQIFEKSQPRFVAILERWFYFGITHTFFRVHASPFIKHVGNPSYPILSSDGLLSLLRNLYRSPGTFNNNDLESLKTIIRIHGLLIVSSRIKHVDVDMSKEVTLLEFIESAATLDPRRPIMVIATSSLIEILMATLSNRINDKSRNLIRDHQYNLSQSFPWTDPLWRLLRKDGWCPSHLSAIFARQGTSSLWFLYHLNRPPPDQEHPFLRLKRNRSVFSPFSTGEKLCTTSMCKYRMLNDSTYKTMHTDGCDGSCNDIAANPESLCSILRQQRIPLIFASKESSIRPEISFRAADNPRIPYIAISHVWSDGLGNPRQNSLPICQFVRISHMVRSYRNIQYFWLDTLCVPPDASNLRKEQDIAMVLMRQTYEWAKAVLVVDSWTVTEEHKGRADIENLHKVFFCAWNTRLWTFQEGALAQTLLFKFRDGIYNVDEGIQRIRKNDDMSIAATVKPRLLALYDEIRVFRDYKRYASDLFTFIVPSMAIRTTSVAADEPLCLAALLNFDAKKILETKKELRMLEFWRMFDFVPAALIFSPEYSRMNVDGYRWAPRTLLGVGSSVDLYGPGTLLRTEEGLFATGPGLRLKVNAGDILQTIRLRDERDNWYLLYLFLENCYEAKQFEWPGTKDLCRYVNTKKSYGCEEVGFIFRGLVGKNIQDLQHTRGLGNLGGEVLAMVAIKHEGNGLIHGRFLCCGILQKMGRNTFDKERGQFQDVFEKSKKTVSADNIKNLKLDNSWLNFGVNTHNLEHITKLAELGVISVKTAASEIRDERVGKNIAWVGTTTKKAQKWCIS